MVDVGRLKPGLLQEFGDDGHGLAQGEGVGIGEGAGLPLEQAFAAEVLEDVAGQGEAVALDVVGRLVLFDGDGIDLYLAEVKVGPPGCRQGSADVAVDNHADVARGLEQVDGGGDVDLVLGLHGESVGEACDEGPLAAGGGVVGEAAALMAAGLGADVTIADISLPRLRQLDIETPANVHTLYSSEHNIRSMLPAVDIVVGSVLVPGDKTPHLITKEMLKLMEPGTVLVDVAIDQGGCFETSHPTTHSDPIYTEEGIVHYCVANIPGAVPNTSTLALTNATLRYAVALADKGWQQACKDDAALGKGLNIVDGKVVYKAVADVFGLPYEPLVL